MIEINLFDQNFSHIKSQRGYDASCFHPPEIGKWTRNNMVWKGDTVFTDEYCFSSCVDNVSTNRKIAWLMESPGIKPHVFNQFHLVQHKFDLIISFLDKAFADSFGFDMQKYVQCPLGGAWVEPNFSNDKKTKLCSLIASNKNNLPGHKLRHSIASTNSWIDLYGSGYKKIENKSEGLKDYSFSVIIENLSIEGYFTEKLIDCLLMKTIPIYWGDPKIHLIFNKNGIIKLDEINNLTFEMYESMLPVVKENFEIALKLKSTDDNLFKIMREIK